MDDDHWTSDEWWFWYWLNPWATTPPPPHSCFGCIVWIIIGGIADVIIWWVFPLLF